MRSAACLILVAALAPVLFGQEGLSVEVKPIVEGKAEPGKEYTLNLEFTVPDGYHAYHKDNPGYSLPVKVTWTELSGLELVKETWPEPNKHKDDFSEEWELSGVFKIGYTFKVPADAKGKLAVAGKHETQFCDENGCMQSEAEFTASIEVGKATTEAPPAKEELPVVKIAAAFDGGVAPGSDATLKVTYTFTKGYHIYAKDNPGFGLAPNVEFGELAGMKLKDQKWPEAVKHEVDTDWIEWEYQDTFTVTYTFSVPKDAKAELTLSGKAEVQICDEDACHMRTVEFKAKLKVKPAKDEGALPTPRRDGVMSAGASSPLPMLLQEGGIKPTAKVSARLKAPGQPGGKLKMDVIFTLPSGFHAYHRDNEAQGGAGGPPKIEFTELGGFTLSEVIWPDGTKVDYPDSPSELELPERFTLTCIFDVPEDAYGPADLKAKYSLVICDEACYFDSGEFEVHTHVFHGDFDKALAAAVEADKPLLVDFNGLNCGPCRRMEATVFVLPEVEELFEDYVIVSIMNDINNPTYDALWEKYKPSQNAGVPFYAVMDHDAKVVRGIASTLPAEKRGHEFIDFLKGPEEKPPVKPTVDAPTDAPVAQPEPSKPSENSSWPDGLFGPPTEPVQQGFDFEARFSTDKIKPGGEVTLELHFKLKNNPAGEPYHLHHPKTPSKFCVPLDVTLKEFGGLEPVGDWEYPAWTEHYDDILDEMNYYMLGDVHRFKVPADAHAGSIRAYGLVSGQYCDDKGCVQFNRDKADMLDRKFGWVAGIEVSAEGADSATTSASSTGGSSGKASEPEPDTESGMPNGIIWFLLAAFGAGIITLLTPCVLPVLPLTIGFFVSQHDKGKSSLLTAFIYCTCIVATFTLFGLITSIALGATGAQNIATNGYVNVSLGVMFLIFALSFLGLFELRVPTFMTQWFNKKQVDAQKEGHGYAKAFFSGAAFSLISFSCTGPIAGTFLAQAATGSIWVPTAAMMAFSSGMALPIFVMGQFPGLMKKMPKSGGWMNAMKVVFGFIEVGLAVMYFSAAEQAFRSIEAAEWVSRYVVISVWAASSLACAVYLFGFFRMPHDHEETKQIGVVRSIIAIAFLAFGIYMIPGMFGAKYGNVLEGILPPPPREGGIQLALGGGEGKKYDHHDLPWNKDFDVGMAEAKANNKPVFLDFTGFN